VFTIKQPNKIIFGKNTVKDFKFDENPLIITTNGAVKRNWIKYLKINQFHLFDNVEPNPSIETVENIISGFQKKQISYIIGLGGGSVLDVAKYVAFKMKKKKIMIPTNFGSGSEVTRISVLKVNGKKKSFHDDRIFADVSILDSFFLEKIPQQIFKNSVIDACAQCTEAYDSKKSNSYTKFLCKSAFDKLEEGIIENDNEKIVFGSLLTGLGFGNSSTTLGHALSYVYSNEGIAHGHALAFTTNAAHKFNNSLFKERFLNLVNILDFEEINLKENLENAAELILTDKKHLDNNPKKISKQEIVKLLQNINLNQI